TVWLPLRTGLLRRRPPRRCSRCARPGRRRPWTQHPGLALGHATCRMTGAETPDVLDLDAALDGGARCARSALAMRPGLRVCGCCRIGYAILSRRVRCDRAAAETVGRFCRGWVVGCRASGRW